MERHIKDIVITKTPLEQITVPGRSGGYINLPYSTPEGCKLISAEIGGAIRAETFVCWLNCELAYRNPNQTYVTLTYYNFTDQSSALQYSARFVFAEVA